MWLLIVPALVLWLGMIVLLYAWTISILWGWFAVPLGVPALGVAHAYGLALLVNMFRRDKIESKSKEEWGQAVADTFLKPLIALTLGFVVKYFFLS